MDALLKEPKPDLKPAGLKRAALDALAWWDVNRRDLPWRKTVDGRRDPYRVWLAEVLLQQTTAAAAAPYFETFVKRWPTVFALAAAPIEEVLAAFAGLGYYARARNLSTCAKAVAARGGRFPETALELRRLPGVGEYIASAVAAIAFGEHVAPVDGNIARVLARVLAVPTPIAKAKGKIGKLALKMTPAERPGDFAEALMDIGAMLCRPRKPECPRCPLNDVCLARASRAPEKFPPRAPKPSRPVRRGIVFFARRPDGAFATRRRDLNGLLGGMLELPGLMAADADRIAAAKPPFKARWRLLPETLTHAFTHFVLKLQVMAAEVGPDIGPSGALIFTPQERLETAGLSSAMVKAAKKAIKLLDNEAIDAAQGRERPLSTHGGERVRVRGCSGFSG